ELGTRALLRRLAGAGRAGMRRALEAEGSGWIETNPARDWNTVNRCTRIQPRLIGAPAELVELKAKLDAELEAIESADADSEPDALPEQQPAVQERLDEVERQLAAFVGFDAEHKRLAGCFVSIAQNGAPFVDKGLVKP